MSRHLITYKTTTDYWIINLLAAALFIALPAILLSQSDYRFVRPSLNEEISNNYVHCLHQDSFGFLWFGTDGGLMKYDGYKITEYSNDPDDQYSLTNNTVFTIFEDPSDSGKVLWLGTGNGIVKFDRLSGKFYQFKKTADEHNDLMNENVQTICKDRYGYYWLGGKGFAKFDSKLEEFTYHLIEFEQLFVYSVCEDRLGNLWLGTNLGLIKYHPRSSEDENYKVYPLNKDNPYKSNRNMISSALVDKKDVLWVGTYEGLFIFNIDSEEFIKPEFTVGDPESRNVYVANAPSNLVSEIREDKEGNIWSGSSALSKINPSRDTLIWHEQFSVLEDSSLATRISALCIDSSGIIWMGLSNQGIHKYVPNLTKFKHYKHNPEDAYSLLNNSVTSFIEDNSGSIWIGLRYGGINKFDKKSGRFLIGGASPIATSLSISPSGMLWYSSLACLTSTDTETKMVVAHFANNANSGPFKFEISENQNINISRRETIINYADANLVMARDYSNGIFYCFVDSKGVIWNLQGPGRTIYQYDEIDSEYLPYQIVTDENISNSIQMIFEDSKGTLWFGTNGKGLIKRIHVKNEKRASDQDSFYQYRNDINNNNSLSNDNINVICEDREGYLWVGTGAGLNKFDTKSETFTRYGVKNGLPSENIAGIVEDDYGRIWISTNKGLSRFDPEFKSFKNFDKSAGLQSNVFNVGSCFKDSEGLLYFGGPNGFNLFNPDEIVEQMIVPNIKITGFQIFNKPVNAGSGSPLKQSVEYCEEIVLEYDQDVFTLEFAGLEYTNPQKNEYAYIMENVDPDWVYTNSERRFATYTNLDPGEYQFTVKGSNNDGIWNEEGTSISIIILPPWWRTYWAYSLYVLILGIMVYSVWQFQLSRLKLKHKAEMEHLQVEKYKEMDKLKSRFFANISHEFRTPLTLISGIVKKMIDSPGDSIRSNGLNTVYRYSNRLNVLVTQLLDLSKLEAGKMKLESRPENIVVLLKGMVHSFSSLSETKDISLTVNSSLDNLSVYIDKSKFEKIINNLLINAFKFTPSGGSIDVSIKKNESRIEIRISDTGIGIAQNKLAKIFDRFYQVSDDNTREYEGTGIGLALTKELVELHRGSISVTSEEGIGTSFVVSLPLGKEHLEADEIVDPDYREEIEFVPAIIDYHIPEEDTSKGKDEAVDLIIDSEKPVLMIVEDNIDVREYIKGNFENEYALIEAGNGQIGFEKAVRYIPDIIISDVMMPDMDGFELLEKLKRDEKTCHIPVIILTAKAGDQDKLDGLNIGADDYLMKPFDAEELKVRVKNLVKQRERLREHFKKDSILEISNEDITSMDKEFLRKSVTIIENHISETSFSVDLFAEELFMSRQQLRRKLLSITGKSPSDLIREIRLYKASKLIEQNFGNFSEIALEVGFSSPAIFTKSFKKQFNMSPSEYEKKTGKKV